MFKENNEYLVDKLFIYINKIHSFIFCKFYIVYYKRIYTKLIDSISTKEFLYFNLFNYYFSTLYTKPITITKLINY